jgi:hypothetical protein
MGWLFGLPIALIIAIGMIYAFSTIGDSPILSAGLTESVDPSYRRGYLAPCLRCPFGLGEPNVSRCWPLQDMGVVI